MGKYAVVIGINYVKNPEAALKGCCNDARIMAKMLSSKGFDEDDVKILIDDDDNYDSPNHKNVKKALEWLCSDRNEGDIIFMHFSGHGTQIPCDGDDVEVDNLDEAICLEELFLMADDDLKQYFSKLPQGVKATVVMDCCHSGSMLDGKEVAIKGAKDGSSGAPQKESSSLLSVLGGSRGYEVDQVSRSLPLATICQVMSQKLGKTVEPTGSGVNGAMAQVFGGSAGKLMMKFALQQLNKKDGGSSSNPVVGMLSSLMGGSKTSSSAGGGGAAKLLGGLMGASSGGSSGGGGGGAAKLLGGLMGASSGGGSGGGGGGAAALLGGLMGASSGGGGGKPSGNSNSQSQNPVSMLSGMMSGLGLESQTDPDAPSYNPTHDPMTPDVCTLITGCQSDETSADVRPAGGDAFGALTKTLTSIHEKNPEASYYDLVSNVRSELSNGGFKQNPCLECSESKAREVFIC